VSVLTEEQIEESTFWFMVSGCSGSPPCQLNDKETDEPCGKPSVVRVILICKCNSEHMFLCSRCFEDVATGNTSCTSCGQKHLEWRMA
jgi:hypothetical protein